MKYPTINTLAEIFYSGQYQFTGDSEQIVKLHFLLQENYLHYQKLEIATKEQYLILLSDSKKLLNEYVADGGSLQHVALKLLARNYLENFGYEVRFEQPFCGYYPDVITSDKLTVIECGHTDNVDKVFTYFTQGNIVELIQIPYPYEGDTTIWGHSFQPKNNIKDFLNFEARSKDEEIKRIINLNR